MPKKIIRRRHRDPLEEAANVFADRITDAVDMLMDRVIGKMFHDSIQVRPDPHQTRQNRSRTSRKHPIASSTGPTLYDDLEVSPYASQETITAAYRSLSKRYHPDNLQTGSTERFKQISSAYGVLGNPEKKKLYDRGLRMMR